MDQKGIENRDVYIDIESGEARTEEDTSSSRDCIKDQDQVNGFIHSLNSNNGVEVGKSTLGSDVKDVKEKWKKTSNKKPSRPPRHPRGLSLDAADQKLIREINELANLKRTRIERMKSLKMVKASKGSKSNNSSVAMVFTGVFFILIVIQGMRSSTRSSLANFQGISPPESLRGLEGSVRYNPTSWSDSVTGLNKKNLIERVAGSDVREGYVRTSGRRRNKF